MKFEPAGSAPPISYGPAQLADTTEVSATSSPPTGGPHGPAAPRQLAVDAELVHARRIQHVRPAAWHRSQAAHLLPYDAMALQFERRGLFLPVMGINKAIVSEPCKRSTLSRFLPADDDDRQ